MYYNCYWNSQSSTDCSFNVPLYNTVHFSLRRLSSVLATWMRRCNSSASGTTGPSLKSWRDLLQTPSNPFTLIWDRPNSVVELTKIAVHHANVHHMRLWMPKTSNSWSWNNITYIYTAYIALQLAEYVHTHVHTHTHTHTHAHCLICSHVPVLARLLIAEQPVNCTPAWLGEDLRAVHTTSRAPSSYSVTWLESVSRIYLLK